MPLHAVTANQPGTGKTLLCNLVGVIATGVIPTTNPYPGTADELRKLATSILRSGPTLVMLDNVEGVVKSRELARLLTSQTWGDRLLGVSKALTMPNRATWMMTGNAVRFGGDLARRVVPIALSANRHDPWNRSGFRHENLSGWTLENRGRLLWACFTLCRAWMHAGRPPSPVVHGGGFEWWSNTIGGILRHAGINGFLGNLDRVREQDWDGESWAVLFGCLLTKGYGSDSFTTGDLLDKAATERSLLDALDGVVQGTVTAKSLGESFARRAGRWHPLDDGNSVAIRPDGLTHGGARSWVIQAQHSRAVVVGCHQSHHDGGGPLPGTGCRRWAGCVDRAGYGTIKLDGRTVRVLRLVMLMSYGHSPSEYDSVPAHLQTRHQCGAPGASSPIIC